MVVESCKLEQDEFELFIRKCKYDMDVFTTWRAKHASHENATFHKKNDWRVQQRVAAHKAATAYVKQCAKLVTYDNKLELQEFQAWQRDLRQVKLACIKEDIVSLPFLNWSAPGSINSSVKESQAAMVSWLLADNEKVSEW